LDDLFFLVQKINDRKLIDYKMQLAIIQNPHVKDPKHLWRVLESKKEQKQNDEFDPAGFALLKSALSKNPRIIVK
jgi:hypothetical protein